jgi:two-component system, cell cycle sensor histidine kinase and response regulator CckA
MKEMPKILIVEDDGIIAKDLQNILTGIGYSVSGIASNAEEAILKFEKFKPELVIMDIVLKGYADGIETASRIRSRRNVPIVYLTAHTDDMTLVRAKITEPFGYVLKPFDEKELLITIEMALYKHEMEAKLRESEETLRALLNATLESAVLTTADGTILALNQTAAQKIGKEIEMIIGQKYSDVIPSNYLNSYPGNINKVINTGQSSYHEEEIDGVVYEQSIHPVIDKEGNISRIAVYSKDITDRKNQEKSLRKAYEELAQTQKELIQSEKLASLGGFASGVAHEIRNPLANISACAQFCISKLETDDKTKEHLNVILRNCEKANQIIKDLLDYARPSDFTVQNADIIKVLNKALNLVKSRCEKQGVEIKKIFDKKSISIFIDEKWMLNAFLNIITNALDAMDKGGELIIEVLKDSSSILIKISDDGKGIPSDIIDKIFEPFFTTKRTGVGLGLPLTQRVVDIHKGKINIESEIDSGTTVSIKLPF